MKKSTSLLLSGLLVSGMVLGTVATPATVVNADTQSESANTVTNMIKYVDGNGNAIKGISAVSKSGAEGSAFTLPEGYELYPGVDQKAVLLADGTTQTLKIVKSDTVATVSVNYIDAATSAQVGYTEVTGVVGQKVAVPAPKDSDYVLSDSDASITLQRDSTYSINVTKNVVNTVIFKTADNTQVGSATVSGKKVGDTVDVTSQLPAGYTASNAKVTLQESGNTQIVTVAKAANGVTPFKSTVKTNTTNPYTQLYTKDGNKGVRALVAGTEWKTANKETLNGVVYYQVSTTEWVKATDVTVVSMDSDTDTNTDNSGVQKADRTTVTTLPAAYVSLFRQDGTPVPFRGLGGNTSWQTDKMITVNGEKMYRVATNEWVKAVSLAN